MTATTGFVRHLVEKKAIVMDFQLLIHTLIQETDDPTNTLRKTVVRNTREFAPECLVEKSSATLSVFPRAQTLSALPLQPGSTGTAEKAFPLLVIISSGMLMQGKNHSKSRAVQVSAWYLQHVPGVIYSPYSLLTFYSSFPLLLLVAIRMYVSYSGSHCRFNQFSVPLQNQPLKSYRQSQSTFPASSSFWLRNSSALRVNQHFLSLSIQLINHIF